MPALQNDSSSMAPQTSLSTHDIKSCLLQDKTISKSASDLVIVYTVSEQAGARVRAVPETTDRYSCLVNLTTPQNTVARIRFVEQTCSYDNYIAVWVQVKRRRMPTKLFLDSRTGCENSTSPLLVDYISLTNHVTFAIVVKELTTPYVVRLHVTAETSVQPMLQLYQVSPFMGIYVAIYCLLWLLLEKLRLCKTLIHFLNAFSFSS